MRRVRRVVRSIDTWTVFKLSVLFYLVLYAILLVAGVLLWNLAYATGTIDNLEHFFESFGWETFRFNGGEIFHSAWIAGLFLVAAGTGLNVVTATVFNLMADLVGGVGVDGARRRSAGRARHRRRYPTPRYLIDASGDRSGSVAGRLGAIAQSVRAPH